jgi:hypothetical protein
MKESAANDWSGRNGLLGSSCDCAAVCWLAFTVGNMRYNCVLHQGTPRLLILKRRNTMHSVATGPFTARSMIWHGEFAMMVSFPIGHRLLMNIQSFVSDCENYITMIEALKTTRTGSARARSSSRVFASNNR